MSMKLVLNPEYGLYEKGGQAFCDSLQVAEAFERRHTHVITTIEKLTEPTSGLSEKFSRLNFELSNYKDASGKKNKRYLLTKDGFVMVTMEFKTAKARAFKEAYITRFNQMEAFIKSLQAAKLEFPAFTAAIMEAHEEPKHYHFSNEINMINRIVLGMDTKHFKELHGLDKNVTSIRPHLSAAQIEAIEALQRIDIGLIVSGMDFEGRKQVLTTTFARRYMPAILSA